VSDREAFERAFVAVTYLLGQRGDLLFGLGESASPAAAALAARLGAPNQESRARALAAELVPVATALEDGGIT